MSLFTRFFNTQWKITVRNGNPTEKIVTIRDLYLGTTLNTSRRQLILKIFEPNTRKISDIPVNDITNWKEMR